MNSGRDLRYVELYESANALMASGDFESAKKLYAQAYALSSDWRTAYGLGLASAQLGLQRDALRFYSEAALREPSAIEPRVNLGNISREEGHLADGFFHHLVAYSNNSGHFLTSFALALSLQALGENFFAASLLRRCLTLNPGFDSARETLSKLPTDATNAFVAPPAISNEDLKLYKDCLSFPRERAREAIEALEQILARGAVHAPLMVDLGNFYLAESRISDAIAMQRRAITTDPGLAPAYHNLAAALQNDGYTEESISLYQKALALAPGLSRAWLNLGLLFVQKQSFDKAYDCFLRADILDPSPEASFNFVLMAQKLRRLPQLIPSLNALRKKYAENFAMLNNLGAIYIDINQMDEAIHCFEEAARLDPGTSFIYSNIGGVYELRTQHRKALDYYKKARELAPEATSYVARILHVCQHLCEWDEIEELFSKIKSLALQNQFEGVNPFTLLAVPGIDRIDQLNCSRAFCAKLDFLKPIALPERLRRERPGRIRVGYLSSDLYDHATSWLIAEIIELHDRETFEIIAYSYGASPETPTRERLRKSFDRFIDLKDVSDEQAAHMIRADDVDILIDLKGYTQGCRTGILTLRPAPIQVNYLGFPGSMGADFIDYIIADSEVIPEALSDGYTEKIMRLPGCYQPNDRKRPLPPAPSRSSVGLPETGFVFCSFNNVYKVTPQIFDVWCRLLANVPQSCLWILCGNSDAFQNLQKEALKRGVDPGRLIVATREKLDQHIARFRCADLFLDTYPCSAHTTASDSLWAGVPVVTMVGDTFASRVAASLLRAVDMRELAAEDIDSYYETALSLATHPEKIEKLKKKLEKNRNKCRLFDSKSYTTELETAYKEMFESWFQKVT